MESLVDIPDNIGWNHILFILAVVEMKSSTSYGTLMAASSNKYEETVYNPATLGKMKEYSEWKTLVKVRTLLNSN